MRDMDELFAALGRSKFRSRFRLSGREAQYFRDKGLTTILQHARDFVTKRLADTDPANDGRQTPMRNHPVGTIRYLSLSMQPAPAAGAVWPNGTISQRAGRSRRSR